MTSNQQKTPNLIWQCDECGTFFTPKPNNKRCPDCNAMNTRPAKNFNPAKDLLYQPKEQRCSKCGAVMRRGYISETSPIRIAEVMERVYWSSDEAGPMGARATTRAYACPDCGYIELFIRRIDKDRDIVMKAPSS